MSFIVTVVDGSGDGIEGIHVRLKFHGLTRAMSEGTYTDREGNAYFDGYNDGEVTIYIDHSSYGTYYYSDGEQVEIPK